jgi:hypothetical protein
MLLIVPGSNNTTKLSKRQKHNNFTKLTLLTIVYSIQVEYLIIYYYWSVWIARESERKKSKRREC